MLKTIVKILEELKFQNRAYYKYIINEAKEWMK